MRKTFFISLVNFIAVSIGLVAGESAKVVQLTPPKINAETIQQEIVCTRPMRDGRFNISLEKTADGKTIAHCYGHGGSGYTTLFGSVNKAISLFVQEAHDKSKPVRVVGAGCMGLVTAIELKRLGYNVVGISARSLYQMASWMAAGYFALVSVQTSPEEQANLNQIGMDTFLTYQQIEQGTHPYITKEAVRYLPVYCSVDTEAGVEDLEARGLIPPREHVTLDFGGGAVHSGYVKYMTYFMNTTALMQQFHKEVDRLGISIELREVRSFDEIEEDYIFNCSGMGSRKLNQDSLMIPVRGHLIALNGASGVEHMNYMIYTKVEQDAEEEYIYMFPKDVSVTPDNPKGIDCSAILGGTFIPHVDRLPPDEQLMLDRKEFKKLLDRNSLFFLGHPYQE